MANPEHLAKLKKGVKSWNLWRVLNPEVIPNLREANLSKADLRSASLSKANLTRANLREANLTKVDLTFGDPP